MLPILDVLYLYFNKYILYFFYVDDIVIIYYKKYKAYINALKSKLFGRYDITKQGDLK